MIVITVLHETLRFIGFDFKTFFIAMLLGQIWALYFWDKTLKSRIKKNICFAIYFMANILWFFTFFYYLTRNNILPQNFTLAWIYRPSISWQIIHAVWGITHFTITLIYGAGSSVISIVKFLTNFLTKKNQYLLKPNEVDSKRRDFLIKSGKIIASSALIVPLSGASYGLFKQGAKIKVKYDSLIYKNLPKELDGFKIAQIADLHLGLWTSQKEVFKAFKLAAQLRPDLLIICGDWVDRRAEIAQLYKEPLKLFKDIPHGVFGVLGNHDHYVGAQKVLNILRNLGVNLLSNQDYSFPEIPIHLVGLEDPGHGDWKRETLADKLSTFKNLKERLNGKNIFKILVNHRPESFQAAVNFGFNLYLAGHTHGGQYGFDQFNCARFFYKHSRGLYKKENSYLNVSCGVSSVGVPFRFGPWPEINILTLKTGLTDNQL